MIPLKRFILVIKTMKKTNLKTLAEELNLSISTVSKALGDSYEIGFETKKKVKELAEKLNYQPNPFASSLRRKNSKTIAVVIPEICNNFFSLAIDGIQSIAQEKAYDILTYLTHENLINEISTIKHLNNGRVDGVLMSICSEISNHAHLAEFRDNNIPLVFFDRVDENLDFPTVTTDNYESSYHATQHLIDAKCKKIVFLATSKHLSIMKKRINGYINALEKTTEKFEPKNIIECSDNNDENLAIIRKQLESEDRPDAIFASVEKLAIATYHICRELNIKIPEDLKVLSYSNLNTASLLQPSLTTISQPAFEIGREAASILIKLIEKKHTDDLTNKVIIKSSLIVRDSSK